MSYGDHGLKDRRDGKSTLRILHVVSTLNPSQGGVPEATRQLAAALGSMTSCSEIVTCDTPSAAWLSTIESTVTAVGPSYGRYAYAPSLRKWLHDNARSYDVLIIHGIWQYSSWAAAQVACSEGVPYFVYSHGQLDAWFRRQYPIKHIKKCAYWRLIAGNMLREARGVVFTTENERLLSRNAFRPYNVNELVGAMGIPASQCDAARQKAAFFERVPNVRGRRFALFMSRIHEVKGLDLLIDAFSSVIAGGSDMELVIAGPDESALTRRLQLRAERIGIAHRITWTGMLHGDARWGAYEAADVFCLPSHSENFGLVVVEALSRGLPVLISDKVNIWREITADGAGFVQPDSTEGVIALLSSWINLSANERDLMRSRARACFCKRFEIRAAATRTLDLLTKYIDGVVLVSVARSQQREL